MDKTTKTLYISFNDEGGNKKNIAVRSPMDAITPSMVKSVADVIINNNLVMGEIGHLKTYNGAYVVTRATRAVE